MTLTIKDLSRNEELDREAMAAARGGMRKLPFQHTNLNQLLTTADGDPIQVYVNDVLINSITTGYAPK